MLDKNPAAGVPLFNEDNKIERYLNEEELQCLLDVLRTDDNRTVCQIALFLLSTGARLKEALQAKLGADRPGAAGVADFSGAFQFQADEVCAPE